MISKKDLFKIIRRHKCSALKTLIYSNLTDRAINAWFTEEALHLRGVPVNAYFYS